MTKQHLRHDFYTSQTLCGLSIIEADGTVRGVSRRRTHVANVVDDEPTCRPCIGIGYRMVLLAHSRGVAAPPEADR